MSAAQLDAILSALRAAPNLEGALCAGQWDLFDQVSDPAAVEHAIGICHQCPQLDRCRAWVDSLPPVKRPPGVTAGRLHDWVSHESLRRPRKAAS
ncbi:MAG: hypothetical protein ACLP4W_27730 [Mycobacterium sp.]|uniref:hypothetical protein n=1 Tax=Mycobacterium sp. TaxID=1785 RepID=UPI003F99C9AD